MRVGARRGRPSSPIFLIIGALQLLATVPLAAQSAREEQQSQRALRAELEAKFERVDEFQLNEGPEGLEGNFFISGNLAPRGQAAAQQRDPAGAVEQLAQLLDIDLAEFSPRSVRERTDARETTHRRYEFFFGDWRVERFELVTHIRADGSLVAANGHIVRLAPDRLAQLREAVDRPVISQAEAEAAVLGALTGERDGPLKVERVISAGSPSLLWSVVVATRNPLGSWKYYVDAHTGVVRDRINLFQAAR
jgi:hypothetical protein